MELVYLWVKDYKNIHKQGFNFSPRFNCDYDDETNELTIDENDDYIENFFGKNINVTAIVGKNGSGKSSLVKLLNEDSYDNHAISQFPINHIDLKLLSIYYNNQSNNIFIYTQQLNPRINSSTKYYQMQKAFGENIFEKTFLSPSLSRTQNDYLDLLHFIKNNDLEFPFFIPSIINIGIHDDYWDLLDLIHSDNDAIHDKFMVFDENAKNRVKTFHVLLLLAHLHNNQIKFNVELFDCYDEIISILEDFVKNSEVKTKINNFIKIMDKYVLDGYIPSDNYIKIDNLADDFFSSYREIINDSNNKSKKVFLFKFYPFLSAGEYQFLYLFSQIHSGIHEEETLLLIDEGESFLHPNWQKKYLSYIVQFIKDNFPNRKIHIILTSHSPFLLSDIPKQNIIFLDRYKKDEEENQKEGNCKVVDGLSQTFGANIHTLLSDSFFMKDGLMGEFAKGKINEIIDFFNAKNEVYKDKQDKLLKTINTIGEPFLKEKLLFMYNEKYPKTNEEKII